MVDPIFDDPQNDDFFLSPIWCLVYGKPETLIETRDQGATDTCYSHVGTATMYGEEYKRKGRAILASRQEPLDYMHFFTRPKTLKEKSGRFDVPARGFPFSYKKMFLYAKHHGIAQDSDYKWTGRCKFTECDGKPWDGKVMSGRTPIPRERKIFITRRKKVEDHEVNDYLLNQPVTGSVKWTKALREWNSDEIYRGDDEEEGEEDAQRPLHGITIVGYGREGDDDYFVCQNSYGPRWGHRGYFKILRKLVKHTYVPEGTAVGGGDGHVDKKQRK